jgi:WD40 repeat protein
VIGGIMTQGIVVTTCSYTLLLLLLLLLLLAQVVSLVARHDGSHAASIGSDGCLRLWSLATGACISNQVRAPYQHLTATTLQARFLAFKSSAMLHCVLFYVELPQQ